MRLLLVSLLSLGILAVIIPQSVSAAPLVPVACQGVNAPVSCGTCEFIDLINNVIQFIIVVASGIAILIFIYAGFLYLTSGGNVQQAQKANSTFTNVVIGFVLILGAFLIVSTIMSTLVNQNLSIATGWRSIECVYPNAPIEDYGVDESDLTAGQVSSASVMTAGDCRPESFVAAGVPANVAPVFSCLAGVESGCNLTADNPRSTARGALQIVRGYNNDCHNLNNDACTTAAQAAGYAVNGKLNCSRAFRSGDRIPGNNPLADACDAAASNFTCNAQAALCLQQGRPDFADWTQGPGHTKQKACAAAFGS